MTGRSPWPFRIARTSPDTSVSNQAEAARQALGARVRGFRKDAGFASGRAFAHATGWQESKVSRIENGKQNVSEDDVRVCCRSPRCTEARSAT
ncbi:helix-turn-helix domain-containing protein [Streptomyces sp. NBC_01808]|uniref:helix-turn-helix domain-containing protein n=1 Tax=Streptomyces sp. NBC_01808 TaxID=2975947 RepID=UPI002DD9636F|nr:helix-turn-helix transcriptional regulator [Streptomyces sp. NBC_01808]WSA39355.1 helix-turn-helix domain-containing protein [Streptomyces sp. NBC_01808]